MHEFVTCDLCNEDGEIDRELIGGLDDGTRFQISGDLDRAREQGWDVDGGAPGPEHICPDCLLPKTAAETVEMLEQEHRNAARARRGLHEDAKAFKAAGMSAVEWEARAKAQAADAVAAIGPKQLEAIVHVVWLKNRRRGGPR